MEIFNLVYAKALYLRFCAIYGDKFVKSYHDNDFKTIWYNEWSTGLAGVDSTVVKGVLETCKLTLEWPPSIAEFRYLCEQASGVPSAEIAMQDAIRRDFSHPVVHLAYDKVGSWAMKNDKDAELKTKFHAAYKDALNQFRVNPERAWELLEQFKALPEPAPIPSKIPSSEEIIGWKERFAKYKALAEVEKAKLTPIDHPQWDSGQIARGGKNFDAQVYCARKEYLMGLDEQLAMTLTTSDQYDRIRFLREDIARQSVEEHRRTLPPNPEPREPPRRSYRAKTPNQYWKD